MLRIILPLLLSSLFLFSFGCEKDNFETTEETPETTEPTIVETEEENYISYRMPSGALITQTGVGLINDEGFIGLATSETAVAECLEGGTISLSVDGSGLVLGFLSDPVAVGFVSAFDVEGAENAFVFRNPDCESTAPELELTTLTDEQAAGSVSVELFAFNSVGPGPGTCEDYTSLGMFEIEFNVSLETCN